MDEQRWTVRVTASATRQAKVHARKHAFELGEPVSFDPKHPPVTAFEYLLGAIGAEMAGGVRHLGRKLRVDVRDVEVLVHARLFDPLNFLRVVDRKGDPRIESVEVKVYIGSVDDDSAVGALWEELLDISPVINTLRRAVRLDISYEHVLCHRSDE
jgi:uncharacterized OsmC-like protein